MAEPILQEDPVREMAIVRSLLDLGASLFQCRDVQGVLEAILREARAFAHAEAGSLYLVQGNALKFMAVQNDKLGSAEISGHLLGRELPLSSDSLAGEAIPLFGRIVGLADVFDAVVSKRCYKQACSLDVALDVLDKDGGWHFDPAVLKAFLERLDDVLELYPALKAA